MAKAKKQTDLEKEIESFMKYCEERNIPVFVAAWDKRLLSERNDGYIFSMHSPIRMRRDMEAETGVPDKFARMLGAIIGFDRDDYEV